MTDVNATVTEGYVWVKDANGKTRITRERLNQAAKPTVATTLDDQIQTVDIKDDQVTAAKLSDALADILPGAPSLSAGTEGTPTADDIVVTCQLLDGKGENLLAIRQVTWWLSGTSGTNAAPVTDSVTVTTGADLGQITAKASGIALTNSSGLLVLTVKESGGAVTHFFNAAVGSVTAELELTFAA